MFFSQILHKHSSAVLLQSRMYESAWITCDFSDTRFLVQGTTGVSQTIKLFFLSSPLPHNYPFLSALCQFSSVEQQNDVPIISLQQQDTHCCISCPLAKRKIDSVVYTFISHLFFFPRKFLTLLTRLRQEIINR